MPTALVVLVALPALVVAVLAAAYHVIFRRPLPRTSGELVVEGLDGTVQITRDDRGVPHVVATTRRDAWLAVGFLHAQDRMWQMEVQRRLAAGRLSEIIGPRGVSADRLMRRLGLRRVSEAEWHVTHAAGPVREEVLAYTAGVNAALRDRPLAAEFTILRHQPEPWEPEDTLAVGRLLSFSQSGNWEAQLVRMRMLKELGPEVTAALDPVLGGSDPISMEGLEGSPGIASAAWLEELSAAEDMLALSSWAPASNTWVLDGSRTTSGRPLLANDPHAPLGIPGAWYRVHLDTGTEELAGLTFCGAPYLVFGRNQRIAWGVVNANVSIQELYVERFNPNNPLQFDDHGTWQDAVRFREVIRVRGAKPEKEDVLVTRRGPIISPAIGGAQPPMSLRWVGFDSEVDSISWTRRLNLATDWKSFRAGVSSCAAPALGITYADVDGNIGYRLSGFVPLRRRGQGCIPSRGWAKEDDWEGFISLEEMPELLNPSSGLIVAANQPVALETCPHPLVGEPAGAFRAARVERLLLDGGRVSPEMCAGIMADVLSPVAVAFVGLVTDAARRFPGGRHDDAVELLKSWDGQMALGSGAAALYQVACKEIFERTAGSRMSKPLRRLVLGGGATHLSTEGPFSGRLSAGVVRLVAAMVATGETGLLWDSLGAAWRALLQTQGADPARWSLRPLQGFTLSHPLAGAVRALGPILNRGPFCIPGDADTIRVGTVSLGPSGERRVASAFYRAVYDLGDSHQSGWSSAPGQSGHPASPHYADAVEDWLQARLDPLPLGQDAPRGPQLTLRKS